MDSKTARNNSKRGKRHELRLARKLGMAKVGPLNDAVDLIGRTFKVQVKTHQAMPPIKYKSPDGLPLAVPLAEVPGYVTGPYQAMADLYPELLPAVCHTYLTQGKPAEDFMWVRAYDWGALHFHDVTPDDAEWFLVMPISHWLQVHGED